MVMTIVDAHNIIKTFGSGDKKTTVLHDISLQIAEHEFIAIMGPSGSGKSTLVKILGLLDRAQKGDIKL